MWDCIILSVDQWLFSLQIHDFLDAISSGTTRASLVLEFCVLCQLIILVWLLCPFSSTPDGSVCWGHLEAMSPHQRVTWWCWRRSQHGNSDSTWQWGRWALPVTLWWEMGQPLSKEEEHWMGRKGWCQPECTSLSFWGILLILIRVKISRSRVFSQDSNRLLIFQWICDSLVISSDVPKTLWGLAPEPT